MKIKGKLLLKEGLLKIKIGELVYITQHSIIIYKNEFYLNISDTFFREKTGDFIIPIKRIGLGNEDFEIDMRNLPLIHLNSLDEPQKRHGWIGPFQFDFEYYTKENFLERYNTSDLLNLMYQAKLNQKNDDVLLISNIRRNKFFIEIALFDKVELEKEKEIDERYLSELVSFFEEMNASGEHADFELEAQRLLITETKKDIVLLNDILDSKREELEKTWFDNLTLEGHRKALVSMDLDDPNADYELAEKHKKRLLN